MCLFPFLRDIYIFTHTKSVQKELNSVLKEFLYLIFSIFALHRLCALLLPELSSFIAAMLFAVHPIHTEAVSINLHKGPKSTFQFKRLRAF